MCGNHRIGRDTYNSGESNIAAGRICSSFQAEMVAMRVALEWLRDNKREWGRARIVTDSQSVLKSMMERKIKSRCELVSRVEALLEDLREEGKSVVIVWVPSHCGVKGNEAADEGAALGAEKDQRGIPCSFGGVKRRVKMIEERKEWRNERCRRVYGKDRIRWSVEDNWSREEKVSMARFKWSLTRAKRI